MGTNILISVLDDDKSMGRMLARVIGAAGLNVAIFTSAEAFLESGRVDDSACVILDVDLPGMSGMELQQRLNESGQEVPIIFISGHADERTAVKALEAGALGFFKKPFSIESLLKLVHQVAPLTVT